MKLLVVRFSSIGDIVLTSPVVKAIKDQLSDVEIHFLTKQQFESLVSSNPNIDKTITIEKSINEVLDELKKEGYDFIIDLHTNVRTKSLKVKLGKPMYSFPKLNFKKWLLVKLKIDKMPDLHVVDRYFQAVEEIGVSKTKDPIEFFIDSNNEVDTNEAFNLKPKEFVTIAIGAQFATKRLPADKLDEIISKIALPVVLIGGKEDCEVALELLKKSTRKDIHDATGKFNLQQSASIVKQSNKLLTHDTGMMHIASAFDLKIVSVWGNTVTQLGMYPYRPTNTESYSIHVVEDLWCRPCSKIGFKECPKSHFNCMNQQNASKIANDLNS